MTEENLAKALYMNPRIRPNFYFYQNLVFKLDIFRNFFAFSFTNFQEISACFQKHTKSDLLVI